MSYTFTAEYASTCSECFGRIEPGDRIVGDRDAPGAPTYRHATCAPVEKPTKFQGHTLDDMGY